MMEVHFGPNSVDEPNLLYKLQCKIKVFNTVDTLPNRGYNLVASSSKYGLVFVGVPSGTLSVYHLNQLIANESEPLHMIVRLPEKPTHIAVSCDYELLAVTGGKMLCIYKVTDFQNPNVAPSLSIKYDVNPSTYVSAMQWNPCIPDSIALAFYDGTLFTCQAATGQVKKVPSKARCICWSPKGKQLVTGNSDGSLHQFKPDLTPAKAVPAPNLFEGAPVEALAVHWISTFQFAVVYKNAADNSRPSVTIVNTPKGGQSSCINYEDICYSMGSNRPWYYFLQGVAQWNIILSASSNSMELATIGSADGASWLQWCQPDEARPELPLSDKKQENYPVGVCIDPCAIHQLPWGENDTLAPMPLLHVVSQTGMLTVFNVINLNKQAPQICSSPEQLTLPAESMTSDIPGETPKPADSTPAPAPKPQPTPVPTMPAAQPTSQFSAVPAAQPASQFSAVPAAQPASQFSAIPAAQPTSLFNAVPAAAPIKVPSFTPNAITQVPKQNPVDKSAAQLQAKTAQPKPQPTIPSEPPRPQTPPENAAWKAEQEKINQAKANQDLKNMLVKEVNDFQNELYNFMLKTRETQARIQRDIESINSNFNFNSLDTEQLKKECSIDELRSAIVQLKLELVRACAVIAEARTHSNAREFHQWTQADPLTTKRVASIKKLAYYVQTQLDQAQKALDYKWSEASRDQEYNVPGKRMIRPILDDVYQPLVKQQEILSRQQAVLRTLRKTLNECDVGPVFKSNSLLRHTPFRNKDPLSKLTKNILNMSIEPQNPKLTKGLLTAQKLEALKDVLANHKTIKIKPVNVELRQHFVTMKENYEKIVREKMAQAQTMAATDVITEPVQPQAPNYAAPQPQQANMELNQEPVIATKHSMTAPPVTPLANMKPAPGLANVARTLFTDEPIQELPKTLPQQPSKPFSFTQTAPASPNTRSVLKDLLQAKSQANLAGLDASNDSSNIFMGQRICSPTGISQPAKKVLIAKKRLVNTDSDITRSVLGSSAPTPGSPPSTVFTSKPISEMGNMFSNLPAPTFGPAPPSLQPPTSKAPPSFEPPTSKPISSVKPTPILEANSAPTPTIESIPKIHSETGEPETSDPPKAPEVQPNKQMTNLFGMKPTAASTPVPDVLKTTTTFQQKVFLKPIGSLLDKPKENVPKSDDTNSQNKKEVSSLGAQTANKGLVSGLDASAANSSSPSNEPRPLDLNAGSKPVEVTTDKTDDKVITTENKVPSPTAPSKQSAFTTPSSTPKEATPPKSDTEKPAEKSPASSLFGAAVAAQPKKPAEKSPASSLFGAAVAAQPKTDGLLASQSSSIFATTNPPSVFGAKSVFGSPSLPTSSLQTPTTQSSNASVFATASESSNFASVTVAGGDAKTDSETDPVVASVSTPSSVLGTTTTPAFSTNTSVTSSSVFGTNTSVTSSSSVFATTPSVFGQASGAFAPTTTSLFPATTASAFGGQAVFGTTTQASVFETTPTPSSVFGTAASQAFGNTTPTTQTGSIFGSPTTQASVFGTGTPTQSVFGTPTQSTQASVFGTSIQTTQASVFGTPTQTTQASVFGTPTQTTQASVFGTPTQTTQASVFGSPTQTTQASVFGTPTQTTQASVFGTPTPTSQTSAFGAPAASSGGSLFGGGEANLFASASISTTSAPTGTSGGNIFGGSSAGSVFGRGPNVFGDKPAFGQTNNNTAASIFGGAAASFGQKPAASLWAGGSSAGGFGNSGFGQATTQASSIFGGGSGGSFSAPSAGAFGSPQQTPVFGTGEQQPSSVFGSPQQAAPGFGGSPAFGSKPAFGQPTGFGSPTSGGGGFGGFGGGFNKSPSGFGAPAAFGGGATFGGTAFGSTSPAKVFGGAAASFGSQPQQSNSTFENLATQNTLTFGSLAQSPQQQPQQPSFNTSPSFTGWRG